MQGRVPRDVRDALPRTLLGAAGVAGGQVDVQGGPLVGSQSLQACFEQPLRLAAGVTVHSVPLTHRRRVHS